MNWLAENWVEIFGFVTGGGCVLLAARRNIWNFPVGLASNVVFIALFFGSALYADTGLQVVYVVLGVTGWIGWLRGRAVDDRAATERVPVRILPVLLVAAVLGTAALTWVLATFTDSTTTLADAATTMVSLVAQFMLNRRWIENWFVWAAVDVGFVALYASKGLWITAVLYLGFIALCVYGYRSWQRAPHQVKAVAPVSESV